MLSSFQRSFIIKQLQSKYEYWKKPETEYIFVKNLSTNPEVPTFGIERDESGYFYLSDNLIAHCNLKNGFVIRIRRNWTDKDWKCYTELYQAGVDSGKFRIDIPLHREEIELDGSVWEYSELKAPNSDYGKNYNDDVFQWPELTDGLIPNTGITDTYRDSVAQYYKEFIDHSVLVLRYASEVAEKNGAGLPGGLCRPSTRFKDDLGYFWSDFDQDTWTGEKNKVLDYALAIFNGSLQFAKVCGVLDDTRIENCMNYAREKWKTI
jgi:hypothetical protein